MVIWFEPKRICRNFHKMITIEDVTKLECEDLKED